MFELAGAILTYIQTHHEYLYSLLFWAVIIAVMLIEFWRPRRVLGHSIRKRWLSNFFIAFINNFFGKWMQTVLAVATALYAANNGIGLLNWLELPPFVVLVSSLLVLDLLRYCVHRLYHNVPLLWRLHRLHHTDMDVDFSTQFRIHPLENFTTAFITIPVIVLVAPSVEGVIAHKLIFVVVAFFAHSNVRLPNWFEKYARYVVTTPDLHKVHHSTTIAESNANFGALFTFWDRMFGTYVDKPALGVAKMEYGVKEMADDKHLRLDFMLLNPFLADDDGNQVVVKRPIDIDQSGLVKENQLD